MPSGEKLAFVDVPGHERFVPNMLAGLGPVPAVMFVVAADGGWMPQSAEHLAAVDALGVRHGLLVVTRSDLADPAPATRQALAEIARTSLGAVEASRVSAVTGQGLDDLRAALARLVAALGEPGAARRLAAPVRLWIDRSFTIRGAGTVVTGTLPAGTVRNGQELVLAPSGRPVRVRGLEALGEPADAVTGVARVALNLRGIPADLPARGMALIEPGRWTLTSEIDVRVTPPAAAARLPQPEVPVRPRGSSAAGHESARPANRARPGARAAASRLRAYARPAAAGPAAAARRRPGDPPRPRRRRPGDLRRDRPRPVPAAARPPRRGRRRRPRARRLAGRPAAADLLRRHKLLRAAQLAAAGLTDLPAPVAGDWLADPEHWAWLRAELPKVVAAFCARDPLAPGMPAEAARAALGLPSRDLVAALAGDEVVLDGAYLRIFARQAPEAGGSAQAGPGKPRSRPPGSSRRGSPTRSRRSSTTSRTTPSRPRTPNGCAPSALTPAPWPPPPASACCCASPTWSCSRQAPTRRRPACSPGLSSRSPPHRPARRCAPPGGWPSRCSSTWTAPG